jgi:hypothetical protein
MSLATKVLIGRDAIEFVQADFAARHLIACDRCGHPLVVHGSFMPGCSMCGARLLCEVQITIQINEPLTAAGGS